MKAKPSLRNVKSFSVAFAAFGTPLLYCQAREVLAKAQSLLTSPLL
jgi:hypothetical protein